MRFFRFRKILIYSILLAALSFTASAQPDSGSASPDASSSIDEQKLVDPLRIIATVNGEEVTQAQLEFCYLQFMYYYGEDLSGEALERRRAQFDQQAMDNAIKGALTRYLGRKKNLIPTDAEVEKARPQFNQMLGAKNREEVDEILEMRGIPQSEVDRFILTNLTNIRLIENYSEEHPTTVTTEMARVFYEDHPELHTRPPVVHLYHIFFDTLGLDNEAKAKKHKLAEDVLKKLRDGANFADMAKQYGEDPSAKYGGNLGRIGPGDIEPEIEKAAFALEPGQISDIVQSKYGYHILTIDEKKPKEALSFERVKPYLIETMRNQTIKRDFQNWLQTELQEAEISIDR